MKKLFSIVLAVVMVLSIATSAMAFEWAKPADPADAFGYKIEVLKFTRQTASLGSAIFNQDANAAAVNGADVYYAIKLTVPDLDKDKSSIRKNAKVDVGFTAIEGNGNKEISIADLDEGVYYYLNKANTVTGKTAFATITDFKVYADTSKLAETAVFAAQCRDTETAKVSAKVYSDRVLTTQFAVGSYKVTVATSTVTFKENDDTAATVAVFHRDDNGKVTKVDTAANGQKVAELYRWLNAGSADAVYQAIKDGAMYMTDKNLRVAFGFTHKVESAATWKANSTPIILDPTVGIPKTGDNASVIGFAMIMVAVVAAAVAVKKVNA